MKSRVLACWAAAMLALLLSVVCKPQAAVFSADAVKAAFLYRFASYVEWPEDAPSGPLVIGVAGAEEIAGQLDQLLPRMTVNGKPAEVRRVSDVDDLAGVHILYVAPGAMKRTRSLRSAVVTRPVLVVSDLEGGLDSGSVINFIETNRNVRFEISLVAADRAHLRITSALLSVAARVERRPQAWSRCADPYVRRYRPGSCQVRVAAVQAGAWR
jgi:hypothetical protein